MRGKKSIILSSCKCVVLKDCEIETDIVSSQLNQRHLTRRHATEMGLRLLSKKLDEEMGLWRRVMVFWIHVHCALNHGNQIVDELHRFVQIFDLT